MGEVILLEGQKVFPEKLLKNAYSFRYPHIEEALKDILVKKLK